MAPAIPASEASERANAGLGLAGRAIGAAPRVGTTPGIPHPLIHPDPIYPHPAAKLFSRAAREFACRFRYEPTQGPEFFPFPRDEDGFDPGGRLLQWDGAFNGKAPLGYAITGRPEWTEEDRSNFEDLLDGWDCGAYPAADLPRILGIDPEAESLRASR